MESQIVYGAYEARIILKLHNQHGIANISAKLLFSYNKL